MRASFYFIFRNVSEFRNSPSYNGAFWTRTRTPKRPTARGGNKPPLLWVSISLFGIRAHAGLLRLAPPPPSLHSFFSFVPDSPLSRAIVSLAEWEETISPTSDKSLGSVRRAHAAQPIRRRIEVPIALRRAVLLILVLLVLSPPPPSPLRPCFASLTCFCCRPGIPGPRSLTPRLGPCGAASRSSSPSASLSSSSSSSSPFSLIRASAIGLGASGIGLVQRRQR
jgi:hypothetical protein